MDTFHENMMICDKIKEHLALTKKKNYQYHGGKEARMERKERQMIKENVGNRR